MFGKVNELVERIPATPKHSKSSLQAPSKERRVFNGQQSGQDLELEEQLRESDGHSRRLEEKASFVSQKMNQRGIKKSALDPSIRNLLATYIHKFLIKLVLKERPDSCS